MLDTCPSAVNVTEYTSVVIRGLADSHDVKLFAMYSLSKLAAYSPSMVSQSKCLSKRVIIKELDDVVDPLKAILDVKLKKNAVKQEEEQHLDLIRSVVRCMAHLNRCNTNRKGI